MLANAVTTRLAPTPPLPSRVALLLCLAGTAFINNDSASGTAQSAAPVAQFGIGFLFGGGSERAPAPMGMPTPMNAPMPAPAQ